MHLPSASWGQIKTQIKLNWIWLSSRADQVLCTPLDALSGAHVSGDQICLRLKNNSRFQHLPLDDPIWCLNYQKQPADQTDSSGAGQPPTQAATPASKKDQDWHKQLITQLCAACKDGYLYLEYLWSVYSASGFPMGSWSDADPKFSTFLLIWLLMSAASYRFVYRWLSKHRGFRWHGAAEDAIGSTTTALPRIFLWVCRQPSGHSFWVSLQLETNITQSDLVCLWVCSADLFLIRLCSFAVFGFSFTHFHFHRWVHFLENSPPAQIPSAVVRVPVSVWYLQIRTSVASNLIWSSGLCGNDCTRQ